VSSGWDPVSKDYALEYEVGEWRQDSDIRETLGFIEARCGGFAGKRVLDLGGGPGQYSVSMAQRGARVTWHDPSRIYEGLTRAHAAAAGVQLTFNLGYLEDAASLKPESFDIVFNRICWYYCANDRAFARLIWSLLAPGGTAYLNLPVDSFRPRPSVRHRFAIWLNRHLGVKIAYTHPPRGRVPGLFAQLGPVELWLSTRDEHIEILLATKPLAVRPAAEPGGRR